MSQAMKYVFSGDQRHNAAQRYPDAPEKPEPYVAAPELIRTVKLAEAELFPYPELLPPPPPARRSERFHEMPPPSPGLPSTPPDLAPEWSALPVHAPFKPAPVGDTSELHTYSPVERRSMVYAWPYLRWPFPDGPPDILDVAAAAHRRRERNHAHLILLVDQGGSMVPFHRFTRDLVETAQFESTIEQADAVYFHNVPGDNLFLEPYLTTPVPLEQVLEQCTSDTSVLLVSDAGAARGYRQISRVRTTTAFLSRLKQRTTLIAWLNPMPKPRWPNTSAQIITHLVPMFQMDPDGLSSAIDTVRGQPYRHGQ